MAKYTPSSLGNLTNEQAAVAKINENFEQIADVLKDKLDRVDGLPNEMQRDARPDESNRCIWWHCWRPAAPAGRSA